MLLEEKMTRNLESICLFDFSDFFWHKETKLWCHKLFLKQRLYRTAVERMPLLLVTGLNSTKRSALLFLLLSLTLSSVRLTRSIKEVPHYWFYIKKTLKRAALGKSSLISSVSQKMLQMFAHIIFCLNRSHVIPEQHVDATEFWLSGSGQSY